MVVGIGIVLVPTPVPVVAPATGAGVVLGAVVESGLGEVDAPLGPEVPAASGIAVAAVGPGATAGITGSSVGSDTPGVGVPPLGGLPEEPVALLELDPLLVLSDILF